MKMTRPSPRIATITSLNTRPRQMMSATIAERKTSGKKLEDNQLPTPFGADTSASLTVGTGSDLSNVGPPDEPSGRRPKGRRAWDGHHMCVHRGWPGNFGQCPGTAAGGRETTQPPLHWRR